MPKAEQAERYGRFSKTISRLERDRLAPNARPPPEWASNPHIVRWWSADYDAYIRNLIEKHGWGWETFIDAAAIRAIDLAAFDSWRDSDPLCERWVDYNVIRNFALARSSTEGFDSALPKPRVRECAVCGHDFDSRSMRGDLAPFGGGELCVPCLYKGADRGGRLPRFRR